MCGCLNARTIVGGALALIGIIIVLCCVPLWLWLAMLGCLAVSVGVYILLK